MQVRPLPDEVFLSWFVRLAHAHGEKVQSLAYQFWGRQRMVGGGLVFRGEGSDLNALAEACRLPLEALQSLTLESWIGFLWNSLESKGARKWVLPSVDRGRKGQRFGQQACPGCLADDETPYFRKSWRLALHCICPVHRATLIDRCPTCGSPILLDRLDVGMRVPTSETAICRCWKCGSDLRDVRTTPDVGQRLVDHQMVLLDTLRRGWINVAGRVVYSTQFFGGLWVLWSFLDDCRWSQDLGVSAPVQAEIGQRCARKPLSHQRPDRRRELMARVADYIEDWPDRLICDMRKRGLSSGKILRFHKRATAQPVPLWLWGPIHLHLDGTMYVPPDAEILEAIRFVRARDGRLQVGAVAEVLNMRTRCNARISALCRSFQISPESCVRGIA